MTNMTRTTYSLEEVQAMTGIGKTSLYAAMNNGQLKSLKFGRRTLVRQEDLDEFLSSLPAYAPQHPEEKQGQ